MDTPAIVIGVSIWRSFNASSNSTVIVVVGVTPLPERMDAIPTSSVAVEIILYSSTLFSTSTDPEG